MPHKCFCHLLGGWVHSVNFSSSGDKAAWVGHDSSISVADASKGLAVSVVQTDFLPFLACMWLSENALVAAVRINFWNFDYLI